MHIQVWGLYLFQCNQKWSISFRKASLYCMITSKPLPQKGRMTSC